MIAALERFERREALGILARAALSLDGEGNPDAQPRVENETRIRVDLVTEVRRSLGVPDEDHSEEATTAVAEALDAELERLADDGTDDESVLASLGDRGRVPGDLYTINIIEDIDHVYGAKAHDEHLLILSTIKSADHEQHLGQPEDPQKPNLVSLFLKHFPSKFPARSFDLLVGAQRAGLVLTVHYAWRLYPDRVEVYGAQDLIEVLRRFSDAFGLDFRVNGGEVTKFLMEVDLPPNQRLDRQVEVLPVYGTDARGKRVQKSFKWQLTSFASVRPDGTNNATLTTLVDVDRYTRMLAAHGW